MGESRRRNGKYKSQQSGGRRGQDVYGTWQTAWFGRIMGLKEIMLDESVRQVQL